MENEHSVPGTVHLVDLDGVLNAKHASGSQNDIVLVPAPSADPDDPLNWSAKRKMLSTSCVCVCVALPFPHSRCRDQVTIGLIQTRYTFCISVGSAAIYSVLVPIAKDTGLTLGDLNAGTGYKVQGHAPVPARLLLKG